MQQIDKDIIWLIICSCLVLLMQAGFCCLESGFVRKKNNLNVAIKNFADLSLSSLVFWGLGFALMFGTSLNGVFGTTGFFMKGFSSPWSQSFSIYEILFCGTAVTIVSGAVAERIRFSGYLIITVLISGFIYPIYGHWAWGGIESDIQSGWLIKLGFIDFAGSTVVHSVGGWVALAGLLIIGPRTGRFDGQKLSLHPNNLSLSTLGTFFLWIGWFGFNGGSFLHFNDQVPGLIKNTILGGISGGFLVILLSWKIHGKPKIDFILNGSLAGLVAVTANCHMVSQYAVITIGAIGGGISLYLSILLEKLQIDDTVNAIPVHLGAGIWGTLAVALFGNPEAWGGNRTVWEQLLIQTTGIVVCFIWAFGVSYALFRLINKWYPFRVSAKEERIGLDISEHSLELLKAKAIADEALINALHEHISDGIITFDPDGKVESINPGAEFLLGYSATEINEKDIHIFFRDPNVEGNEILKINEKLIETAKSDSIGEIDIEGIRKNGAKFPIGIRLSEMNLDGHFLYVGVFQDITERKESQLKTEQQQILLESLVSQRTKELKTSNQLLQDESTITELQKNIAVCANENREIETALKNCIAQICEKMDWPVGHFYKLSEGEDETLVSSKIWFLKDPVLFEKFQEITEATSIKLGMGLPGRVLSSGKPAWILDVTKDSNFPRAKHAENIGVRTGFAFPILTGKQVVGVMEFFSNEIKEPDEKILDCMKNIGISLGRVVERARADVDQIKHRAQLEEKEEKIRTILENVVDGIISIDEFGSIEQFNPSAERLFGYSSQEVIGENVKILMPEPYKSGHDQYISNYLNTGVAKIIGLRREVVGLHRDGTQFPCELGVSKIWVDGRPLFSGVIRDISQRKEYEDKILLAMEAADKANQAKSEFLARMSHELRTPMNAILGFGQLMKMDCKKLGPSSLDDSVDRILTAGKHLLNLINEVLDLAQIESGNLLVSLESVNIVGIKGEILDLVGPLADKEKIQLIDKIGNETQVFVIADQTRLKQVILNLVSNAIKYNRSDGTVTLSYSIDKDILTFKVSDTGQGIPLDQQENIFKPFDRMGAEFSAVEGSGIGMPITKKLTELMGGTLGFESEVGKGSCFHIALPITNNPSMNVEILEKNISGQTEETELNGKLILYIEDNPNNLELVKKIFNAKKNLKLISATNAKDGIDMAKTEKPDLILLDIHLPEMDGFTAFKKLKNLDETLNIPVIAVSADAMEKDKTEALGMGFKSYLTKPFKIDHFLKEIDKVLHEISPNQF